LVVRGHLNKAGTATVNGVPAEMLSGNVFQSTIQTTPGVNTFRVIATDVSGNVTNQNYQVTLSGTSDTYTEDADGNLTQKVEGSNTFVYAWDAENRLKSVTQNGTTIASFAYDSIGRRVQKSAGGVTTRYLYDRADVVQQTIGGSATSFVRGRTVDEILAGVSSSGAPTFYHSDALGSVVKNTNSAGAVTFTYQYDAWGNIQTGATQGGFAFTGRDWDPETGFYYYRARYYDPVSARFISEDPARFKQPPAPYSYVADNPGRYVDPTGLNEEDDALTAVCNHKYDGNDIFVKNCINDKCGAPRVKIQCDKSNCSKTYAPGDRHRFGGPSPKGGSILICPAAHKTPCTLQGTVFHEMLHTCYGDDEQGNAGVFESQIEGATLQYYPCSK
jgi:RHS repeat-associated protein